MLSGCLLLCASSARLIRPLPSMSVLALAERVTIEAASVEVATAPVQISPDAVNMLACHLMWLHRDAIVRLINGAVSSNYTVSAINHALGDMMSIQGVPLRIHSWSHLVY